jgi:hypothetical protein
MDSSRRQIMQFLLRINGIKKMEMVGKKNYQGEQSVKKNFYFIIFISMQLG